MMDIYQILKQLPHRFPILLVDRVLEIEKGVRIKALKNVSVNEPYFSGHFPSRPVMPRSFKRPVEPGDQLILEVELDRMKAGVFKFKARAKVGEEIAVEAELMCTMRKVS